MAQSSILGGQPAPALPPGHDSEALGPSDSSDTGSDVMGERPRRALEDEDEDFGGGATVVSGSSDSDAEGTGERASATGEEFEEAADISPDRIVSARYITGNLDADATDDDGLPPDMKRASDLPVDTETADDRSADDFGARDDPDADLDDN